MLKVCIVIASRANYGRAKTLMRAIDDHPDLQLQLVVGASTLLDRFGKAVDIIKADGFEPLRSINYIIEGESLLTQAKSTGLGIVELSTAFSDLQPDLVITIADRFETMSTSIAAVYMNIPLVHIQGGEVSGNIDDRVRHAITKMADYHFVCSEDAKQRVLKMGEYPDTVFNYGCPAMDTLIENDLRINNEVMAAYTGVGNTGIDWEADYILMVQHPVTTSYGDGLRQVNETLCALERLHNYQKVVLWPNVDAGSDNVSKGIRIFREKGKANNFQFYKNFSPEDYARVLTNAACCVGNSSSFIREGSFLGIPAVIVGDRQKNREHAENICFCDYACDAIYQAVLQQITHGPYPSSKLFGQGNAGQLIARQLNQLDLQKYKTIAY
ncbi:MAG: UDP-N-acetylglucosamine 2-epimerase (hydrolyzing) [Cellvibrionaceae bacterium]|nr:UDP-N-acetylglucosamine 2-epimerase (hydrolyzing) [Cellvibrionaceae bacterium]